MTRPKDVWRSAPISRGLTQKISPGPVSSGVPSIRSGKITLANVWQNAIIGTPLLMIPPHSVWETVQLILSLTISQ